MWSTKRSAAVLLILNLSVVYSASNFNGTQSVASTSEGVKTSLNRPSSGEGCISGNDDTVNSGDLCLFSCGYGFCPEPLCTCLSNGPIKALPPQTVAQNATALDEHDMDLNHLCQFACQYGHCPDDICNPSAKSSEPQAFDYAKAREENSRQCLITKDRNGEPDVHGETCINVCQPQVDQAKAEGRITSYGCLGHFPLDKEIPWQEISPGNWAVTGTCLCDNKTVNWAGGLLIDILAGIGQASCYIFMSTLKIVFEVGTEFIPGPGKAIGAGLDMAVSAAKTIAYTYPAGEDPAGAFDYWLSPCGKTDLVPDDLKKTFDILSTVADGVGSWKPPKNGKKGMGRKGDAGNPTDRTKPHPGSGGNSAKIRR